MQGLPEQLMLDLSPERSEESGRAHCGPYRVQAVVRTDVKSPTSEFSRNRHTFPVR